MPSRVDRAATVTRNSLALAAVPAAASLLAGSKVARALSAGRGVGVSFPFPTGLPTLWTYVSLPGGPGPGPGPGSGAGSGAFGDPLSPVAFVPLFLFGLLVTSVLEAGFLGALANRIDGDRPAFVDGVRRFTGRMVGVNALRAAVVFAAAPLLVFPPLAVAVVALLSYLLYGLPFEVVVRDASLAGALGATLADALDGGRYALFGVLHLGGGAMLSVVLTGLVRNAGLPGVLLGAALVALPATFVAVYGLLIFRDIEAEERPPDASDLA